MMKQHFFHNIFKAALFAFFTLSTALIGVASENYPFAQSSLLSSGKWVKVRVPETGIYEISYDQLQEMGFDDPTKVGVYGKGGVALPNSFTDGVNPSITDDLKQVGTLHKDNKIYFYGRGVEEIAFNSSSSAFEKKSLNIYALDGVYFLSDCEEPLLLEPIAMPSASPTAYYLGFDYVYHEKDLYHNTTQTGQLFWGENLMESPAGYTWELNLPLLDLNAKAKLESRVYAADKSSGSFRYGVTGASSGNRTFNIKHPASASGSKVNPEFLHMANPVISLTMPATEFNLYNKVENGKGDFIHLDYWIFSYSKVLPDFSTYDFTQERFTVKSKGSRPGKMTISQGKNVAVFDITDKGNISLLAREDSEEATSFYFDVPVGFRDFIFCDLSKKQLEISGFEPVENSNLHHRIADGADFLIITVPQYKDFAQQLADLHNQHNGMKVIVALTTEVYNEFSGGMADPMAIRGVTKMCFEESGGNLKNLLLIGKFHGDYRHILSEKPEEEYLIGFQDNRVTDDTHASNAMDFFGFTDDEIYSSLQNNPMNVGVGLLPFHSEAEAQQYLKKVEAYLNDKGKAEYANEFLSMGGVGDNHTHDMQAKQLAEYWDLYANPGQNNEILAFDAYGEALSNRVIKDRLNSGVLLSSYFGHGACDGLNTAYEIFKVRDIPNLKNEKTGFMFINACDLSDTDHARKGFGEKIVTETSNGVIGAVIATRTVWSGQNFELAKLLSSSLFSAPDRVADLDDPSVLRTMYRAKSPTIGEVFARAKTLSNYTNSLAYIYIGDPALTIPVPLRRIIPSDMDNAVVPGELVKIKGTISTIDSIHLKDIRPIESYSLPLDEEYNGELVVKVCRKGKTILSKDYITNTVSSGKEIYIPMPGEILSSAKGKVKNGKFDFEISIPNNASICNGDSLEIRLCAYDYKKDLAASGRIETVVTTSTAGKVTDTQSPAISISNDEARQALSIVVSDNAILSGDCLSVSIDNIPQKAMFVESSEDGKIREYFVFTDHLPEGEYNLLATAKDIASNESETSFSFEKSHRSATLAVSANRKAVTDEITFSLNNSPTGIFAISILDSEGRVIAEEQFEGDSFTWYCNNSAGNRVAPGLYRAIVRATDAANPDLFSSLISFAIIE